ncbi:5-oxoprolinase subunit B family protein [Marinospirillum perlucidum]|uniref:5-oxoprolinase subunit B family protein n=1 Tax=Marinospirillum perlucidum TaxID=1982602 RepID=UPI001FE4A08D|nr:allophanate hydrolase subunit 1 [Marinospirillum perlucidum]
MTETRLPMQPRLESAGLDAWILRLFDRIDETNLPWLTALTHDCEVALGDALVDLVPSYTTLLVVFDPLKLSPQAARQQLEVVISRLQPEDTLTPGRSHELPTYYHPSVGPDLERVAQHTGLSVDAVIACHSEKSYRVFALGFAPGFAFMGLADPQIECPRFDTPRQRVPVGSVALAARQTAAYPAATPGGWNLLGRTSARLFDRDREGFSLLQVGDEVRFLAVDREEFVRLGGDLTPVEAKL